MEELNEIDYYELRPRRRAQHCQCGTDLPGTCPGPRACPYSGLDEEHDATCEEEAHA
jgi:hypothetical protein